MTPYGVDRWGLPLIKKGVLPLRKDSVCLS
jgi:hypothetical protein